MATTNVVPASIPIPAIVRRNTLLLALAQCVGWLGLQMIATLAAIVAYAMTADQRWSGIPVTLAALSAALVAPNAGRLMDKIGRRPVLVLGQIMLGAGSAVCGLAVLYSSFAGFLGGIVALGIGTGITALSRSAAADMYPASRRAQGMSLVVMGGAVGAIMGPQLLAGVSAWSKATAINPLIAP